MSKDITKKVLKTIKDKQVKPVARWTYLLKNGLIWGLFTLSVIIGALATAVIIFVLRNSEWAIYSQAGGFLKFTLVVLPYFWLVLFILFLVAAYYNFKHTRSGYRYPMTIVVLVSLVLTVLLGAGVYATGVGEAIETKLEKHVPLYQKMIRPRQMMWQKPHKGLLPGKILQTNTTSLQLLDLQNKEWQVDISDAEFRGYIQFMAGERIKIIGEPQAEKMFKAHMIRPWLTKGKMLQHFSERKFPPGRINK